MTIAERWTLLKGRPSGFDYLRIALSVTVLLWHSYQMSYGRPAAVTFWQDNPLGLLLQLVLPMFFALSGFLVSGSMYRNPRVRVFLTLRAIRIFPALVVEITLSALILGPLLTTFPLRTYFAHPFFFSYLANVIGWVHYRLPGVFLTNPFPEGVNTSLWTIPFELECYILISLLALVGMFRRKELILPLFATVTAGVLAWNLYSGTDPAPPGGLNGRLLVLCFFAGIVIYGHRDRIPWNGWIAVGSALAAIIFTRLGQTVYLTPLFAAYLTVYLGLLNPPRSVIIDSGDYSYGTYLYAGPIQQTVAHVLGASGTWALNVAISLPATVIFALFSWWVVEKPFLKVRRYLGANPAPAPVASGHREAAVEGDPRQRPA